MIVATDIAEVHEIMADTYRQHVMIVSETQMHVAPWLHAEEGWQESRLRWAVEAVCAGQVRDLGLAYEVQGDTARYTIPKGAMHRCPCPAAHYGPSQHCKHRVALELYRRVLQAYPDDVPSPVDDQTLPLALGPVSVEERLAQTPHVPQEDRMTEDPDAYIPEPGGAPVAVLDAPAPAPRPSVTTPATSSLDAQSLLQSMAAWKEQRQILARYIKEQLTDGVDYYTLRIKGRDTKPTLSKAGSEKFLAIFKLTATFQQDQATWTMLGSKEGVLCYTCTLLTREGTVVGEGRGARTLAQDQGDINKAVKMAQKSAQIDAILRTGCLSDVFTQDIEDLQETPAPAAPARPTSAELRAQIWAIVKAQSPDCDTRARVEAWIKAQTGYDLHPDHYQAILTRLQEVRS